MRSGKGPMTEEQKHEAAMFEKIDAQDKEKEIAIQAQVDKANELGVFKRLMVYNEPKTALVAAIVGSLA